MTLSVAKLITPLAAILAAGLGLVCLSSCGSRTVTPPKPIPAADALLIIPRPKSFILTHTWLRIDSATRLVLRPAAGPLDRMAALSVQSELHEHFGLPRLAIIRSDAAKLPGAAITFEESTAAKRPEGYQLHVGPAGVVISGHDARGTFYGAQTLCQMFAKDAHGTFLPGADIDDYPTLLWRGAHLFVGNHALPFHEKLIARVFARLKLNNLVLQCEQAKWDTLGKAAPPWAMSKKDLKTEIAFARSYGMTVTPLVNSVGHMPWLFTDPANLEMAEDPQTPYAACVDSPRTDEFLFRLHDEVLDTFHSDSLHIGGDEVTQRGRYPYRSRSACPTVAGAFVTHVLRLHDHLKARGVRTLLWSDMLLAPGEARDAANAPTPLQAAEMRLRLPKDIVLTDWHYTPNGPYPSPALLQKAGFGPVIGATCSIPSNIAHFSQTLADGHQRGLLQTTWAGYNSSEANFRHEKRQFVAFVVAAECAWNGGQIDPHHLPYDPAQVFDRLYGAAGH